MRGSRTQPQTGAARPPSSLESDTDMDGMEGWEQRVAEVWARIDAAPPEAFRALISALAAERGNDDPEGLFERASSHDSTDQEAAAAPLYERALAQGLTGIRRRRAVIQLASTLRNLGQPERSLEFLEAEMKRPSDMLDDAVSAFLALAYCDLGRERQATSLALKALSKHLPRYNRSLNRYADELVSD